MGILDFAWRRDFTEAVAKSHPEHRLSSLHVVGVCDQTEYPNFVCVAVWVVLNKAFPTL